jgi:hypothetical protein
MQVKAKPGDLLDVIAPDRKLHGPGVYDLASKVFSGEDQYFQANDELCRVFGNPRNGLDWNASRVALDPQGQVLANFTVWDYRTNVGRARLRTGGIGCVCCHGKWRKQGVVSRLAESSLWAMEERGYDLSILFGIPDFYHKFGYVRAWSETGYELKRAELADFPSPGPLHRFSLGESDEAAKLYNRIHGRLSGTARRPKIRVHFSDVYPSYGWLDSSGALRGYIRATVKEGKDELLCLEAVGDVAEIKGALFRLARSKNCRRVRLLSLPERHPLLVDLRRGNCKRTTEFSRRGEAMVTVVNLESCLRKMEGELSARLRTSELAKWRGEFLLDQHGERVLLGITKNGVKVKGADSKRARNLARAFGEAVPSDIGTLAGPFPHQLQGGDQMAQLILGSDEPEEIVVAGKMRLRGDARRLLPVLFPNLHPNLSTWDRY